MTQISKKRCGFVAVIGAPNAGKSTLVNTLVGLKVSIVSPKVQTTRALVRGIAIKNDAQIVFVDTPGLFDPQKRLEKAIVSAAWNGQAEADMVLFVADASNPIAFDRAQDILARLASLGAGRKIILALNKVDKINPETLLDLARKYNDALPFEATFMISALKGKGTDDLLEYLAAQTSPGEWLFPEEQVSDMPMQLLSAEITREKLFHRLHQELPYALTVETESWEDFNDGSVKISQIVYVARTGHKGIVLGQGGQTLKTVGEQARRELEEILERRVHLKLHVKVKENWQDDPERYQLWGLDPSA